jgi:hypothetical protein
MMASVIYEQVFGKTILPLGKPWIGDTERPRAIGEELATERA